MIERVIWLNGTVGTGKSTVGAAVADRLAMSGEVVAFVSTDALGALSPRPPGDPFNTQLVAENLRAVAVNFSAAGVRTLVVAGVISAQSNLELFERALESPITVVRLIVPAAELERRLRQRHGDIDPSGLRWHLDRAPTLTAILDASGLPMVDITNLGHPNDTAQAVIAATGQEEGTSS